MQRVIAACGQLAVDVPEVRHPADLRADDDPVVPQTVLFGQLRRHQGGTDHRLYQHVLGGQRVGQLRVLVHQGGQQALVKRAPVDTDAHGPVELARDVDDRYEVAVEMLACADIAGVDAVLRQCAGRSGKIGQEQVAVVVEVADQRDVHAGRVEPAADLGHCRSGSLVVDGDADDLAAGCRQRGHLFDGGRDVGRVGVGHRLHDDRAAGTDRHATDHHGGRVASRCVDWVHARIVAAGPAMRGLRHDRRSGRAPRRATPGWWRAPPRHACLLRPASLRTSPRPPAVSPERDRSPTGS